MGSFNATITERFSLRGSYSYAHAELTDAAPNLITALDPPGFGTVYVDGQEGDRLPGSPKYQASLYAEYNLPLSNGLDLNFAYGFTASGDVLTRTGGRGAAQRSGRGLGRDRLHRQHLGRVCRDGRTLQPRREPGAEGCGRRPCPRPELLHQRLAAAQNRTSVHQEVRPLTS